MTETNPTKQKRKSLKKRKTVGTAVTKTMEALPSTYLLQYASTQDLLMEWLRLRDSAINYGDCIRARFIGGGNPALRAFKAGEIDKIDYEVAMAITDWYESIFNLIQGGWEYIEESLVEFSRHVLIKFPATDTELYLEVLKELWDAKFIQCINGTKFSVQQVEKSCRSFASASGAGIQLGDSPKVIQLRNCDREKLKSMQGADPRIIPWLATIIGICTEKAESEGDEPLLRLCRNYFRNMQFFHDKLAHVLSIDRKKNTGKFTSYQWENGLKRSGTKGGFTYLHQSKSHFPE